MDFVRELLTTGMGWIKSIGWIKTAGLVLGAVLLALYGAKAAKRGASAQRKEDKALGLLDSAIAGDLKRADKLMKAAGKDKEKAFNAQQNMQEKLNALANQNADLDSVVGNFNSVRRKQ